eukprot:161397_1
MLNWFSLYRVLRQYFGYEDSTVIQEEFNEEEVIILYPPHFAKRMQISSCLVLINSLTCLYYGYNVAFVMTLLVSTCSFNHWRYPVIGMRRSMDLIAAQIALLYHIYIAYHNITTHQWVIYVYIGLFGSVMMYLGAIYLWIASQKDYASRFHFMMHIWGICANSYLYFCIYQTQVFNHVL